MPPTPDHISPTGQRVTPRFTPEEQLFVNALAGIYAEQRRAAEAVAAEQQATVSRILAGVDRVLALEAERVSR